MGLVNDVKFGGGLIKLFIPSTRRLGLTKGLKMSSSIRVPFTTKKPRNLQHYMDRGESLKSCCRLFLCVTGLAFTASLGRSNFTCLVSSHFNLLTSMPQKYQLNLTIFFTSLSTLMTCHCLAEHAFINCDMWLVYE
jgi:hypothetical protein